MLDRVRRALAPRSVEQHEDTIRLVVGLGNPGADYVNTRHNVGLWTLDILAKRHGVALKPQGHAALATANILGKPVALAKPLAYVNQSGAAVRKLLDKFRIDGPQELLVVADDLDLPLARLRLRQSGGSGGYKGLQSVIDALGTNEFPRLRIGIGRPLVDGVPTWDPAYISNYVLSDPVGEERTRLVEAAERAADAIESAVTEGIERAMQSFN